MKKSLNFRIFIKCASSIASFFSLFDSPRIPWIVFHPLCLRFRGSGFMVMFEGSKDCSKITLFEDFDDLWRSKILRNFESVLFSTKSLKCIFYGKILNWKQSYQLCIQNFCWRMFQNWTLNNFAILQISRKIFDWIHCKN